MSIRVPDGWSLSNINETCEVLDSKRIPLNSQDRSIRQGLYPYYGANGVQGYIDDFIFNGEYVLLAEDGGYFDAWDSRPISYLVSGKFWVNNHAHILKAKKGHDTKYIHYSLVHKNILKHINGGTRSKLNQSDMREIEFLIPPAYEQQKIATILSSVDDVIEKTRAQIDKLKDLKTGMMQELFSKGIGHTEFKDSPIGSIPFKWEVAELKEYLSYISYGFTNPMPESDFGPLMVTAKDINLLKIRYETARMTTLKAYEEDLSNKSRPRINDILLTKDGTLGRVAIVERENICINQSVAVLRTNDKVMPKFLLYLLASPLYQREMLDNSGGSTIKHIYITVVDKMKVAVPEENEQIKIVNILDSLFTKLSLSEKRLNSFIKIKKALMRDLLTGKVRVNVENHQEEKMAV